MLEHFNNATGGGFLGQEAMIGAVSALVFIFCGWLIVMAWREFADGEIRAFALIVITLRVSVMLAACGVVLSLLTATG